MLPVKKSCGLLTFSQSGEDVLDVVAIGSRCVNVLDALAPCKGIGLLLVDRLIDDVALVSSHHDRCIFSDLVDQLFVPGRCPLEGILVRDIVH